MNLFQVVILGIVEGVTEFLPISSTGHLILTAKLLRLEPTDFLKSFEIIIQLGAILAVVFLYWRMIWRKRSLDLKVLLAFIPTAIIGFILYYFVKKYLLGNETVVLWALALGGAFIIILEYFYKNKTARQENVEDITGKQAIIIGVAQSLAMIPGVSRSAATIFGGMFLGISRKAVVEFSFLLAIPTMIAATGLDLWKNYQSFSSDQTGMLLIGFAVSFLIAILAIKFLIHFIQKNTFAIFGWYRIVVAIIFWLIYYLRA